MIFAVEDNCLLNFYLVCDVPCNFIFKFFWEGGSSNKKVNIYLKIYAEISISTDVKIKIDSLQKFNGIMKLSFSCIAIFNL